MREKHRAGLLTAALFILVAALSCPHVLFKVKADDFLHHKFTDMNEVRLEIDYYRKPEQNLSLTDRQRKAELIHIMQQDLEYDGILFYHTPIQLGGNREIYCLRIYDNSSHGGSWQLYISDSPEHNYLYTGGEFDPKFAVNDSLLSALHSLF